MIVDSSAIVAVFLKESGFGVLIEKLGRANTAGIVGSSQQISNQQIRLDVLRVQCYVLRPFVIVVRLR